MVADDEAIQQKAIWRYRVGELGVWIQIWCGDRQQFCELTTHQLLGMAERHDPALGSCPAPKPGRS
jgi:hypothetical protein